MGRQKRRMQASCLVLIRVFSPFTFNVVLIIFGFKPTISCTFLFFFLLYFNYFMMPFSLCNNMALLLVITLVTTININLMC